NSSNGVSKLHGTVSRKMWRAIWADPTEAENPIIAVTHRVHTRSRVSPEQAQRYHPHPRQHGGRRRPAYPTRHHVGKQAHAGRGGGGGARALAGGGGGGGEERAGAPPRPGPPAPRGCSPPGRCPSAPPAASPPTSAAR